MEKYSPHLGYFDIIAACAQPGCPVCQLGNKVVRGYLDMILYESVADPDIRDQLRASLGYCKQHAWLLPKIGKGNFLGVAIIYQDLLGIVNKTLPQVRQSRLRKGFARLGQRFFIRKKSPQPHEYRVLPEQNCPACALRDETEANVLKIMIKALVKKDEEMQNALKKSDGLCLPHVRQALTVTQNTTATNILIALTEEKIAEIQEYLKEFIRKHDYRFQHEQIGREKESWKQAITFIVGTE